MLLHQLKHLDLGVVLNSHWPEDFLSASEDSLLSLVYAYIKTESKSNMLRGISMHTKMFLTFLMCFAFLNVMFLFLSLQSLPVHYGWLVLEQPLNTVLFNFASRAALLCIVCCFWCPAHNQKCLNINANHHFVVFITVTGCELCRQCNRLGFREPGPLLWICRDFISWSICMVSPWLSSFFNEK